MTTRTIPTGPAGRLAPLWRTAASARRISRILTYISLVAAAGVVVGPLLTVFLTSLKTPRELARGGVFSLPGDWLNLSNYLTAFENGNMLVAFGNTAFILVFSVTGTIVIGTMAAYAIDRFHFRMKRLVIALFLMATLVPGVTTQVATFKVIDAFGLFDTRWGPILLYMGTDIVSIYIFLQFIRNIPVSLDEAARLDGASSLKIYRSVILPLLKPAIATVVIIKGITVYNEFYIPFLYMPSEELGVISTSLFRFKGPFGAHWEIISAGAVLVILPTLVIFLALQRFIYNGFTAGAVK
ncbi:carbohydrate ABC transporter permease [Sphaerisporangium album]|uniref:Carbohydrate ABC transporter permease n=1 Tax=Sphaerisporangium album TaxID=509200 RepID=A0A367FJS5_9ACTN|nr:carbohydrate ABC transporter permease [Sphaerisporangium album]RCG29905.1 carbohydrate ABC transporter permease [Sphaerisporangium album]